MLESFLKPMVSAHRGACKYAPENTIASFDLAVEQGADAIELDAKLSADGKVMVIHDQTVDRTTNGKGKVNQLTHQELKQLDAGSFFDPRFSGERIPTLDEVFESVGRKIFINVELTNYASRHDELVPLVDELHDADGAENRAGQGDDNPEQLPEMSGAVDLRRLVELGIHGGQGPVLLKKASGRARPKPT